MGKLIQVSVVTKDGATKADEFNEAQAALNFAVKQAGYVVKDEAKTTVKGTLGVFTSNMSIAELLRCGSSREYRKALGIVLVAKTKPAKATKAPKVAAKATKREVKKAAKSKDHKKATKKAA